MPGGATFISPDHHPAVIVARAAARYAAAMLAAPHRLTAKRLPMLRRAHQNPDDADWVSMLPPGRSILRRLRAIPRMLLVLVWTLVAVTIQAALVGLPGRARGLWPRAYWGIMCRLIGLRVRVIGAPAHRT